MELHENSLWVKMHRYFYMLEERNKLPNNLCSYFWLQVWMLIWIIPMSIFSIPYYICRVFYPETEYRIVEKRIIRFAISLLLYLLAFGSFLLLSPIQLLWKSWSECPEYVRVATAGWCVIVAVVLIIYLLSRDKATLLGEYIVAKKQKICPRITWKK